MVHRAGTASSADCDTRRRACRLPRVRADRWLGGPCPARGGSHGVRSPAATQPLVLTGWSPTGDGPAAAVRDGVLDAAAADPRSAVDGAELVDPGRTRARLSRAARRSGGGAAAGPGAGCRHHRRGQHQGRTHAARDRARPALRRRPPDGRIGPGRLRRVEGGPVRRSAVGRGPGAGRGRGRARGGPGPGRRRAAAADVGRRPRPGGRRDQSPAARRGGRARRGRRWITRRARARTGPRRGPSPPPAGAT